MTPEEYAQLSARDIAQTVSSGKACAREVVEAALEQIAVKNPALNAFTVVRHAEALAEADALDALLQQGSVRLPLAGVPIAVKEEYDVTGLPTTLGGWGNTTPVSQDSEAIRRVRAAGAIVIGKTTMPEFGQYTDTVSARYGVTRNPHNPGKSAGGSSGGSAVAVASGMVPVALAADGGGSIRIPASCCGIVGLKPARGRISPAPLSEHWFGLVTLGAVTRTVADTAVINDVLSGSLPGDRFQALPMEMTHEAAVAESGQKLRIVWSDRPAVAGVKTDPAVAEVLQRMVALLERAGHNVRQTKRPWPVATLPFFAQFAAGMTVEADSVQDYDALESRTRVVAKLGRLIGKKAVERAVVQSEKIGRMIDQRFLSGADVIMLPTMPISVPDVGVVEGKNAVAALMATSPSVANTALFNVSGHPAISVPGPVGSGQMPVGIQFVARPGQEYLLIALARQCEELLFSGLPHKG